MKTRHLTSFIAIGALLPLTAWADDTDKKHTLQREAYDPRPSETRSGSPVSRSESRDRTTSQSQAAAESPTTGSAASAGMGIERVSKEQLEQRVTATDLIGTKVLDREGREIGKVKDIGLTAVAPQLSSSSAASNDAMSSDSPGSSGLSQPWTQPSQTGQREARVLVRPDRSLDAGDALVAIPAAQLHRDGDALRIDVSREELRSLVSERTTSRVSMNR